MSFPPLGLVAFRGRTDYEYNQGPKFMRHVREDGPFNNTLKLCGADALTPYTRFYVEPSAKHDGAVHIRSCYNNKYWVVAKADDGRWYVFVNGERPEEDKTKPSCTLFWFQPYILGQLSIRTCLSVLEESKQETLLYAKDAKTPVYSTDWGNYLVAVTLDDEKLLPKYVRFKGDNGKYLGCYDGNDVLKFGWTDPGDASVIHTVHYAADGTQIRIQSNKTGRFWRPKSDTWIASNDDGDDTDAEDVWFQVIRLGGNVIALKNKGNNRLAMRWDGGSHPDGLCSWAESTESRARLRLEEAVVTRKIYDVEYHLDAAKIYDRKALVMATANSVNHSSTEATAKLSLKYGLTDTSSWGTSTTGSWGVSASITAGVPKLFSIGMQLDITIEGHYEHSSTEESGATHTRTEEHSVEYEMKVPPRTKMTLRAIATQASCDVPYSYRRKDLLTTGVTVVTKLEDGLFRGVGSYDFTYKLTEEKLADSDDRS